MLPTALAFTGNQHLLSDAERRLQPDVCDRCNTSLPDTYFTSLRRRQCVVFGRPAFLGCAGSLRNLHEALGGQLETFVWLVAGTLKRRP